jgi:hypothetical protein
VGFLQYLAFASESDAKIRVNAMHIAGCSTYIRTCPPGPVCEHVHGSHTGTDASSKNLEPTNIAGPGATHAVVVDASGSKEVSSLSHQQARRRIAVTDAYLASPSAVLAPTVTEAAGLIAKREPLIGASSASLLHNKRDGSAMFH